MATFRKRHSRKYRNKNTRRNTRKSHINRRGKKSLLGGGWISSLGAQPIMSSLRNTMKMPSLGASRIMSSLTKSINMPSYFSKSDLRQKYDKQGIAKFIKDIQALNFDTNKSCTNLQKLKNKQINDYNTLRTATSHNGRKDNLSDSQKSASYGLTVRDIDPYYWYEWTHDYKRKIGHEYHVYSSNIRKFILYIIANNKKFILLMLEFRLRELELYETELQSSVLASSAELQSSGELQPPNELQSSGELQPPNELQSSGELQLSVLASSAELQSSALASEIIRLKSEISKIKENTKDKDETQLIQANDDFDEQIANYLKSDYIDLQYSFHPGARGIGHIEKIAKSTNYDALLETYKKTRQNGETLIDMLKSMRRDITTDVIEYCNLVNKFQKDMIKYYASINQAWVNAMKETNPDISTKIYEEGIAAANALKNK